MPAHQRPLESATRIMYASTNAPIIPLGMRAGRWLALVGIGFVLAGCGGSGSAGGAAPPSPDQAAFESAVMAQGGTKEMADCALNQAGQSGMTAKQLLTEYRGMQVSAIPDALTNTGYDALTVCQVPGR
jgi:hypothetical protein